MTDNLSTTARLRYRSVLNGRASDVFGTPFTITGDSFFVFDYKTSANPQLLLTMSADWLGIVRNVADFDVSCGGTVSGEEETQLFSSVTIRELAGVGDTVTVSYSSPGGSSSFSSFIGADQSQTFDIPLNFGEPTSGSFPVTISWKSRSKSCNISFDIIRKIEKCGNGNLDEGETCNSCPADAGCVSPETCDANPFSSTFDQCVSPTIPPISPGEAPFDFGILIWVAIGIVLVAGVVLTAMGINRGLI